MDLIVVGGDFNASCGARVGYVVSEATRGADARLLEWSRREGLAWAAPDSLNAAWQGVNEGLTPIAGRSRETTTGRFNV